MVTLFWFPMVFTARTELVQLPELRLAHSCSTHPLAPAGHESVNWPGALDDLPSGGRAMMLAMSDRSATDVKL